MPEPAQLRGYPLLRLGVEGNGKLKQKCQRGSEFRCAPAIPAFVGRLVRPAPAVADVAGEPPRNGRRNAWSASASHCRGQGFESPQLHQEVGANRPGFTAPTIPRLFGALARKLMVCRVYSDGTTGLGRRMRPIFGDTDGSRCEPRKYRHGDIA
jgi:hypothetical protein